MSRTTPGVARGLVLMVGFLTTSLVAGVLGAGLAMPLVGATGTVAQGGVSFFDSLPSELDRGQLSEFSRVLAADNTEIARFYDENRTYTKLSSISPLMRQAIVAIEDSRFYEHGGIDPRGVIRAVVNNSSGGDTQGASTLTQQYVKNVLVEAAQAKGDEAGIRAATAQTKARKLREMKIAIGLEKKLTKDQILEGYLNIAFFSNSTYGVEAASQLYFSKPSLKLTLPEAATLAGMVQQPSRFNPLQYKAASEKRRNIVLARMLQLGMITQADHDAAIKTRLTLKVKRPKNGCANAGFNGYFCDYVDTYITTDPDNLFAALGKTPEERRDTLRRGGLTIVTTLDPRVQKKAQEAVNKKVPVTDKSGIGAAAVTVEPGTGNIIAMAQNRIFDPDPNPQRGRTTVNYNTDSAYGGSAGFQTGSTFKAFTLAAWLSAGKSLNATVDGKKRTFSGSGFRTCSGPGTESYTPANAADGAEDFPMSVMQATADSVNVAYVDMEHQIGICAVKKTAEALGVHLAKPNDTEKCKKKIDDRLPDCIPSLTLGVKEIAPLTMASAYAAFAAGGVYCKPRVVSRILKPAANGQKPTPVPIKPPACKQAVSPAVAAGTSQALKGVLTNGTASRIGPISGYPSAGKTGTTNDYGDSWFVGYTAQRSTAVWVSDPGRVDRKTGQLVRRKLRDITIGGQFYSRVFGATIAAPIWKDVMTTAMKVGKFEPRGFGTTPGNLLISDRKAVPNVLGKSGAEAGRILLGAGFKVSINPNRVPSKYPAFSVADTSPAPGSRVSPGTTITVTFSSGPVGGGNGNGNGNGFGFGNGRGNGGGNG